MSDESKGIVKEALFMPLRMAGAVGSYIWNTMLPEMGQELARQTSRGATELAAGIFNGSNAFVMYGDRYPPAERDEPFQPLKTENKQEAKQEQKEHFSPKDAPKEEQTQQEQQKQQQKRGQRQ